MCHWRLCMQFTLLKKYIQKVTYRSTGISILLIKRTLPNNMSYVLVFISALACCTVYNVNASK